jgi:Na+-transporting methylmalonyl-CoA/oxaloacetate decarboxylase gamma subunit
MEALNEIATTGSPAIMTALGMGTVFLCLVLLYLITRIIGSWLPRLLASAGGAASVEPAVSTSEDEAAEIPATRHASAAQEEGMVAAMALALARHRASRMRSDADEPRGVDPWKIAGRIRTLRDR